MLCWHNAPHQSCSHGPGSNRRTVLCCKVSFHDAAATRAGSHQFESSSHVPRSLLPHLSVGECHTNCEQSKNNSEPITLVGGVAKSTLLPQILADVLQREVHASSRYLACCTTGELRVSGDYPSSSTTRTRSWSCFTRRCSGSFRDAVHICK